MYRTFLILPFFFFISNPEAVVTSSNSTVALINVTLFDGNGGEPLQNAVILIEDKRITCVGTKAECAIPGGSEIINLNGKYVTPGLVDTHMHFFQTGFFDGRPDALDLNEDYPFPTVAAYQKMNPQRYYDSYLCSGVTAVYDVGGMSWSIDLQESAEQNPLAPHVAASGPLLTPVPGAPFDLPSDKVLVHLNSVEAGTKTVQYLSELGSTGIKFWQIRNNDPEYMSFVEAAAEEIKRKGNMMIAHATTLEQAKAALKNGAKFLVHSVEDEIVDDEFIQMALENQAYYNPTLIVGLGYILAYRAAADIGDFKINDPNGCVDEKTRTLLKSASKFKNHPQMTPERVNNFKSIDVENFEFWHIYMKNLVKIYEAGVKVVVGSDAGNPGTLHGVSIYDELEAMQRAGIPPSALIVMATKNGAEIMRRADDFGTIEKGKFANLIVMNENPSEDIANMRTITHTMIKGRLLKVTEIVK